MRELVKEQARMSHFTYLLRDNIWPNNSPAAQMRKYEQAAVKALGGNELPRDSFVFNSAWFWDWPLPGEDLSAKSAHTVKYIKHYVRVAPTNPTLP